MLMIFINIVNIAELDVERACIILSIFRAKSIGFEHENVVAMAINTVKPCLLT